METIDLANANQVESAIEAKQAQILKLQQEVAQLASDHVKAVCSLPKDTANGRRVHLLKSVHHWFELTYAQYLTIPRSVLQAMPKEWQDRFVRCLEELDDAIDWRPKDGCYRVELREETEEYNEKTERFEFAWGDVLDDRFANYRHPVQMPWKK